MMSRMSSFCRCAAIVIAALAMSAPEISAQEPIPLSRFAGTWVGLQSWTVENPSAQEPQTVTLTLELVDGELRGSMAPFLGLRNGARITDARVVGEELHATATGGARSWQGRVGIQFRFSRDAEAMTGTADLTMGDVDWLEFDYELSLKRSRY